MPAEEHTELLDVVTQRHGLLRAVGRGTVTKQELVEARPVSRSTVDRGIRTLEDWGLVVRERGTIRRTLGGDLAVEAFESFFDDVTGVCAASEVIAALPRDAPISIDLFRGATVVSGTPSTPHRPTTEIAEFVRAADHLAGYVTTLVPSHVDLYREQLVEEGCRMDLVLTDGVLDALLDEHAEAFREALETENYTAHVSPTEMRCTLLLRRGTDDHEVCLAAHDDHGIAGVVRNDASAAVSWGCDAFRSLRYEAEEITVG